MDNRNDITRELMDLTPSIVQIDKTNLYSVPPAYFETLPSSIIKRALAGEEGKYNFGSGVAYTVPEGYFESLPGLILGRINKTQFASQEVENELQEVAPFLNTISKKTPYEVPASYFSEVKIPKAEMQETVTAKVVAFNFKKAMRYAVAAIIIGLIAITAVFLTGKDPVNTTVASTEKKTEVKHLSEEDIEDFLTTNALTVEEPTSEKTQFAGDQKVKEIISEMSEEDIKQYLQETGINEDI